MTKEGNYKIKIGSQDLEIKIKNWAEQASGSCLASFGDTEILATAVMSKQDLEGKDFFPLTVEYEERYYAAGKIFGSRFIRRETRPTDEAILTSRMIDRSIRPRFPEELKKEVQIIITCLSWDTKNDPDILGIIATSIALSVSDIPWSGPLAALRIGRVEGNWILNPTYQEREKADFDLVLAAVETGNELLINMIEFEGKEISESEVLEASKIAQAELKKIINFQKEIAEKNGKEKFPFTPFSDSQIERAVKKFLDNKMEKALFTEDHLKYQEESLGLWEEFKEFINDNYSDKQSIKYALSLFDKEKERVLQENIIKNNKRPDGRKLDEIRKISCEVGVLPKTHGSGFFSRGLTRVLSILTLGGPRDQKLIEGMEIVGQKRFLHHYNFPPYSSGEVGQLRGPKRREIGHGALAEKALLPLIPDFEKFPYTIRVVSEVLSSNGSTSMASVSAASLALMDAGVPIKRPAAGIALGIVSNGKEHKILTDIQGPEDSAGGMDFKVAGTEKGITAIQLDVKIDGISIPTIKESLERAKSARMEILKKMKETITEHRTRLSPFAPKIYTLNINPDKIGEVIGPKGSIIKKISAECQVTIDVDDSGLIYVAGEDEELAKRAVAKIKEITKEVEIGEVFEGKVKRILNFGAFVEISPGQSGLVHISNFVPYQIRRVEDIVKIGETIPVKVISIDELGRINLSAIEAGFKPQKR